MTNIALSCKVKYDELAWNCVTSESINRTERVQLTFQVKSVFIVSL
jgi:hypothetical protein